MDMPREQNTTAVRHGQVSITIFAEPSPPGKQKAVRLSMAMHANLFNVPRPREAVSHASLLALPLNLLSLIISHLDNVGDLARCCQICRVMHYMTKPVLFENITLCSYDTIRYRDDRPEGLGSSSPFAMGLNALVTRDVGSLVRSLTLQGQWREHDLEEFASAGRVPDDAMMLNIAVRAAIDRCSGMESFKWNLNTKLLSNVYSGLASLPKLQRLHVRFPSSRSPRPLAVLPGMSSLRSLTVTHMDPLCYPDDIALILFASPKLEAIQLHWSPRMRDEGEPSVQLHSYFRHNIVAKKRLKLKHVGFYNLFALTSSEIEDIFDYSLMQSVTMLNAFGVDDEGGQKSSLATFLDGSWARPPDNLVQLKSLRHDKMSKKFARHLSDIYGLEKIYLVNARHVPTQNGYHPPSDPSPISVSTPSSDPSSETIASARTAATNSVRDLCLEIIISNHGPTLKHLVLPDRWPLPDKLVARLFNGCPNITQLALALELRDSFGGMRMLLPFLKKIRAVRILMPLAGLYSEEQLRNFQSIVSAEDNEHEEHMGRELAGDDFPELRYIGIGWKVWEIGGTYEKMVVNEDGEEEMVLRRRSKRVERDAVRDVEIWKMDSLDIV